MIRSYSFQNPRAFPMACATFETTAQKTLGTLACSAIYNSFSWNASLSTARAPLDHWDTLDGPGWDEALSVTLLLPLRCPVEVIKNKAAVVTVHMCFVRKLVTVRNL